MPTRHSGLTPDVLNAALVGLEAQRNKLQEQIAQVRSLLGAGGARRGRPPKSAAAAAESSVKHARKRAPLSPEARARISAAQKKRWAAAKRKKS